MLALRGEARVQVVERRGARSRVAGSRRQKRRVRARIADIVGIAAARHRGMRQTHEPRIVRAGIAAGAPRPRRRLASWPRARALQTVTAIARHAARVERGRISAAARSAEDRRRLAVDRGRVNRAQGAGDSRCGDEDGRRRSTAIHSRSATAAISAGESGRRRRRSRRRAPMMPRHPLGRVDGERSNPQPPLTIRRAHSGDAAGRARRG